MFSDEVYVFDAQKRQPRIPFGTLLEHGLLRPGQTLFFSKRRDLPALVLANGQLRHNGSDRLDPRRWARHHATPRATGGSTGITRTKTAASCGRWMS